MGKRVPSFLFTKGKLSAPPCWTFPREQAARLAREYVPTGPCLLFSGGQRLKLSLERYGFPCRYFSETEAHDRKTALAVFWKAFSGNNEDKQQYMLAKARQLAPVLLLVDWRLAERNLDIPACALGRLWSGGHRDYFARGALEGIVYSLRNDTYLMGESTGLAGSLGMVLLAWNPVM